MVGPPSDREDQVAVFLLGENKKQWKIRRVKTILERILNGISLRGSSCLYFIGGRYWFFIYVIIKSWMPDKDDA